MNRMEPDIYSDCEDPVACIHDGHLHCANADCGIPNQEHLPPGYSPYCAECDPRNRPDAQEVFEQTGLGFATLKALRRRTS